MTGAETLAQAGEMTYKGKATIKRGPVTAAFGGTLPSSRQAMTPASPGSNLRVSTAGV